MKLSVLFNLLPENLAYVLDAAFNGELRARYISVPDALVFESESFRVRRIIEARTGIQLKSNLKLAGFKNLTAAMRENPEYFIRAIGNVLRGRGGILNLSSLDIPPDGQIEVDFYSPRKVADEAAQRNLEKHPFKAVNYRTLPLPIYQAAE